MSLLNTNSPSSTEDLPELTPQKNILISLILLISGLALTSILAFNEIKKNSFSERKAKASKTDSDSISPEQQETAKTSLFERFKKPTTQEDASQN
ncbi:MAG TPA: hypothetical protein VIR63_01875, partial [Pontiella sp.]